MTDKDAWHGIGDIFGLGWQRTVSQQVLILPPLTKPAGHYLTGYEGSPCKSIEDYDMAPFKYKQKGIDTDEFKKQCEDIDKGES